MDSLTFRERPRIGIPDNAPDALREALLIQQAKQDSIFAQFRPKAVPNTNFKMLKLSKATYVWTSDRGYIFQTRGLKEWEGVDEDNEALAARLFQKYKKARAASKAAYIQKLVQLSPEMSFRETITDEADVSMWIAEDNMFLLPNTPQTDSPQAKPMPMLIGKVLKEGGKSQIITLDFESDKLLVTQKHRSINPVPRQKTGTLPITFLQENKLLAIEEKRVENASDYLLDKAMQSDALYPLQISETRLLHNFQKYLIDYIKTDAKGKTDTIKAEVVRPVFTSFLTFNDPEKQTDFVAHLVAEKILAAGERPKLYHSTDTSYTATIVERDEGLFWSMQADIERTEFQDSLLLLVKQCPSAYQLTDMRTGIRELSLDIPSLFTPLYRTIKNNWKSSQRTEVVRRGQYTRQWQFNGFKKAAPDATSVDMLLEIVNAFYGQVAREAQER